MSVWGVPLNPTVANAHDWQAVELWHTHCVLQPTLWQVMLPFRGDTRVGCANVGCHHSGSLYHLLRSVIMPHSTLLLPLESLNRSPSPPSGGTADTLPYAVPGGRFTHWMSCSIHGGRPHLTTRQRVERCSMLSLIGMRECSTLNRDAYAREPCLRRSLRALRLKADVVAWSSLRCVMSSCAQHLYTHLHSLSHRHPTPAAGRRTTPRPSLRSVVKSVLVVPDVGRCGLASGSRPMLDGCQSATPHGTRSHTCRRLSLLCLLTS